MHSLTVIIPTLNEGESIGPTIDAIPRDLEWLKVDIIVVDGNSTDATAAEAEKRGARVINERRKGYGRAYKTGFAAATGEDRVLEVAGGAGGESFGELALQSSDDDVGDGQQHRRAASACADDTSGVHLVQMRSPSRWK